MNNIAFPKLGISLNISPVAFSIGSKPIYWYALIILSGFLLGLFFVYKTCQYFPEILLNFSGKIIVDFEKFLDLFRSVYV